jgi:hypothetical protein
MIQIQVDDHVADALAKQAKSRGLSLSDYPGLVAASQPQVPAPEISADELDRLIEDEASDDVTLGGTLSRAEIYNGHD